MSNAERSRKWREENPERYKEYHKQYRLNHKDKVAETVQRWKEANPDKVAQYNHVTYLNHKDKVNNASKEWREANREATQESHRNWNHRNKETLKVGQQRLRTTRRLVLDRIKIQIGCCNPSCGWGKPFESCDLDFHHVNQADKCKSVSGMVGGSIAKLAKEIRKCTVLCAVCHRRVTYGELTGVFAVCQVDDLLFCTRPRTSSTLNDCGHFVSG